MWALVVATERACEEVPHASSQLVVVVGGEPTDHTLAQREVDVERPSPASCCRIAARSSTSSRRPSGASGASDSTPAA